MPKRISHQLAAIAVLLGGLLAVSHAHPANIPISRAKVSPNGSFDIEITFDILAFVLDQTPQVVLDAPMNGLIDGPVRDLQDRLNAAKTRFLEGFVVGETSKNAVIESIQFPTAAEIHQVVNSGQLPRLPVMMTVKLRGHLNPGVQKINYHFPEVMGTVVVTTEFPYTEAQSESVDPGESSALLTIPSQAEIDRIATTMTGTPEKPEVAAKPTSESATRRAIQSQYNTWSKAYMGHDVPVLLGILAPTYTLKTAQGKVINYSEYKVMLDLRKQKHSDTTLYKTEIMRMTLKDGVAAIFSRETTTDPGINQKTGKREPVSYQHDYIDLWVLAKGRWLLKSTVTQREQLITNPMKK